MLDTGCPRLSNAGTNPSLIVDRWQRPDEIELARWRRLRTSRLRRRWGVIRLWRVIRLRWSRWSWWSRRSRLRTRWVGWTRWSGWSWRSVDPARSQINMIARIGWVGDVTETFDTSIGGNLIAHSCLLALRIGENIGRLEWHRRVCCRRPGSDPDRLRLPDPRRLRNLIGIGIGVELDVAQTQTRPTLGSGVVASVLVVIETGWHVLRPHTDGTKDGVLHDYLP